MSVHSLPIKRRSGDGAGVRPASAALFGRPRELRRRVLIRRSWVRAAVELTAADHDLTREVIGRGRSRVHDRRAA
jgi:hypothetical protein